MNDQKLKDKIQAIINLSHDNEDILLNKLVTLFNQFYCEKSFEMDAFKISNYEIAALLSDKQKSQIASKIVFNKINKLKLVDDNNGYMFPTSSSYIVEFHKKINEIIEQLELIKEVI